MIWLARPLCFQNLTSNLTFSIVSLTDGTSDAIKTFRECIPKNSIQEMRAAVHSAVGQERTHDIGTLVSHKRSLLWSVPVDPQFSETPLKLFLNVFPSLAFMRKIACKKNGVQAPLTVNVMRHSRCVRHFAEIVCSHVRSDRTVTLVDGCSKIQY